MKRLFVIIIIFSFLISLSSNTNSGLIGKWWSYAYFKNDGTYVRSENGVLLLEFLKDNKVKLLTLDKVITISNITDRIVKGIRYTHLEFSNFHETWIIERDTPGKDFIILNVLYKNEVIFKLLMSDKKNYFNIQKIVYKNKSCIIFII